MAIFFSYRKKLRSLEDQELVSIFKQSKDNRIIDEFYQRYSHLVLGACMKYLKNKMDAEDITISIFSQLAEKILKHDIIHFKSWLHTVTKNESLMMLRKKKILVENVNENSFDYSEIDTSDEKNIIENRLTGLENAINQLKHSQKQCLELFYFHKKSYDEIIKITGFSAMQVKSNIQNAKRSLRIIMDKNGIE